MLLEEWNSGWKLWGTEGLKTVEGFRGGSECLSQQAEHQVIMHELNLELIISKGMLPLVISLLLPHYQANCHYVDR